MSSERKQLLPYAIASLLVVGVGLGLILPLYAKTRDVRSEIAQLEHDLGIQRGRTDGLSALAMQVADLREQAARNNKTIPSQIELANLLRELDDQIEAERLTSRGISTEQAVEQEETTRLPLELTLYGPAPAIFRFIDRVESMPRMIQVDELEIERDFAAENRRRSDAEIKPGHVEARVRLNTFYSGRDGGGS